MYLASSQSSSVSSSMLRAASSGNSLGTVGARLGDAGGRTTCAALLPARRNQEYNNYCLLLVVAIETKF